MFWQILSWYTKDILAIIRQVGIQGSDRIIDGFKIYLSGCLTINSIFPQTRLLILQNIFPLYKDHNMTPLYHLLLDLLFKDMNENLELRINIKKNVFSFLFHNYYDLAVSFNLHALLPQIYHQYLPKLRRCITCTLIRNENWILSASIDFFGKFLLNMQIITVHQFVSPKTCLYWSFNKIIHLFLL